MHFHFCVNGRIALMLLAAPLVLSPYHANVSQAEERPRARDLGITPGALPPGRHNAVTDVPGVRVGHATYHAEPGIHTGATAIVPRPGNVFQQKAPAAIVVANGFGKLVGSTQVNELGQLETPILLTNTLNVWEAASTLAERALAAPGNESVRSVNPVVGETNDGHLNDIRRRPLTAEHFRQALQSATTGPVEEGSVGAGAGTMTMGYKGGVGTSSRVVETDGATFTVGVLVQTNFDGALTISGIPVGRELAAKSAENRRGLAQFAESAEQIVPDPFPKSEDGSCMIVLATDAPLDARQLRRLAARTFVGMARTGANFSHGSGDYAIAFSTADAVAIPHEPDEPVRQSVAFSEPRLTALFEAAADATEESIYNALLRATTVKGHAGHVGQAIPIEPLKESLRRHGIR